MVRATSTKSPAKPPAAKRAKASAPPVTRVAGKPAASRVRPHESGASARADAIDRAAAAQPATTVSIRPVRPSDLAQVIAIDSIVTGLEKADYWRTIHRRYGDAERAGRRFLVAEANGSVAGFVIGEVRDWEFGSPPCGWVFAIDVHPQFRLAGLGTRLVGAMADWFRREGVDTMRTILARDNTLILSFFRSLGMTTGPFIPLEIDLQGADFFPIGRDRAP
ncbi:MAG: GNAT family N-acetyltransferase [Burkholderiaceae bacterium]|nr:GNAT family N-acetyltransferase [Burkholderiaceae bacterium]